MQTRLGTHGRHVFGYTSPCASEQSVQRQLEILVEHGVAPDDVFSEAAPWGAERPALAALMERLGDGDSVVVVGLHRLGHSAAEIVDQVLAFQSRGITLTVLSNPAEAPPLPVPAIGGPAHFLGALHANSHDGPTKPFGRSRPIGRPVALDAARTDTARRMIASGMSKTAVAKILGVSRPTLYKALAALDEQS
ncbi:recombinase family protein [Mycolicibacterium rutilum]|uniref:recombinase family protein n=1 Tax=Mycolicibacterium rutilum TaxID=370526 RepID=UPI00139068B9|nr:recombinase family protein [Mycolicibacterium rutilum]